MTPSLAIAGITTVTRGKGAAQGNMATFICSRTSHAEGLP